MGRVQKWYGKGLGIVREGYRKVMICKGSWKGTGRVQKGHFKQVLVHNKLQSWTRLWAGIYVYKGQTWYIRLKKIRIANYGMTCRQPTDRKIDGQLKKWPYLAIWSNKGGWCPTILDNCPHDLPFFSYNLTAK